MDIIGEDYQRAGDIKNAIEIFQLNLLAYPDSADAHYNLADAYLADGQKDLAWPCWTPTRRLYPHGPIQNRDATRFAAVRSERLSK